MNRRILARAAVATIAALWAGRSSAETKGTEGPLTGTQATAAKFAHRLAMQIDTDDVHTQLLALGNARNYAAHYREKGEDFAIRIVAFGPGYALVRADASSAKEEFAQLQRDLGAALAVLACENTRRGIAKREGKKPEDIALLPGVEPVPSGIVALAEFQEAGWSYIRP